MGKFVKTMQVGGKILGVSISVICGIIGWLANLIPSMCVSDAITRTEPWNTILFVMIITLIQCTAIVGLFVEPIVQIWAFIWMLNNYPYLKTWYIVLYVISLIMFIFKTLVILISFFTDKSERNV